MKGLGRAMTGGVKAVGEKTGRQADYFYPTPPEVTEALLDAIKGFIVYKTR